MFPPVPHGGTNDRERDDVTEMTGAQMSDIIEIEQLLAKYAAGMTRDDVESVMEVFTAFTLTPNTSSTAVLICGLVALMATSKTTAPASEAMVAFSVMIGFLIRS